MRLQYFSALQNISERSIIRSKDYEINPYNGDIKMIIGFIYKIQSQERQQIKTAHYRLTISRLPILDRFPNMSFDVYLELCLKGYAELILQYLKGDTVGLTLEEDGEHLLLEKTSHYATKISDKLRPLSVVFDSKITEADLPVMQVLELEEIKWLT